MRNLENSNYSLLVRIVMAGLPDSSRDLKRALVTLHTVLPKTHPDVPRITQMISSLNQVERLQAELSLGGECA